MREAVFDSERTLETQDLRGPPVLYSSDSDAIQIRVLSGYDPLDTEAMQSI
jgi:hypothetical protein